MARLASCVVFPRPNFLHTESVSAVIERKNDSSCSDSCSTIRSIAPRMPAEPSAIFLPPPTQPTQQLSAYPANDTVVSAPVLPEIKTEYARSPNGSTSSPNLKQSNTSSPVEQDTAQQQHQQHPVTALSAIPSNVSASKKRRASGALSRGVANLTPEQLAKKRANDREAQRAIRERTKLQIENLERRIQELTDQPHYQELQQVLRQKQVIEAENEEIKRRLADVLAIIKPLTDPNDQRSNGVHEKWQQAVSQLSPRDMDTQCSPSVVPPGFSPREVESNVSAGLIEGPQQRLGVGFLLDGPNYQRPYDPRSPLSTESMRSSSTSLHPGSLAPQANVMLPHAIPPKTVTPTCLLDSVLFNFLKHSREQMARGVPVYDVIGPPYPSITQLLHPEKGLYSHPLSNLFTDTLKTFPKICRTPEKIAVLYIMFLVMRWQVAPTLENYELLPHWANLSTSQIFLPHPAWIDFVPWPRMRDALARDYKEYQLDDFFVPYTITLSLNWPYDESTCYVEDPNSEELLMAPAFEAHLRDLSNWSLGPDFARKMPALATTCRIVDKKLPGQLTY